MEEGGGGGEVEGESERRGGGVVMGLIRRVVPSISVLSVFLRDNNSER